MPLPRKGDPRRPLHLAVRSMRLLGGLLMLFGTCATVPFAIRAGGTSLRAAWFMVVMGAFYFVPGAAFIALSVFLDRRQFWAVVASICLAALALLFSLAVLLGTLYVAVAASPFQVPMLIPVAVMALVVLALAQLIYHLALSFEAIKHLPEEAHGFEPIMVPPPPPAAMYPQQRDEPHEPPFPPDA